jgi:hypothetical protein
MKFKPKSFNDKDSRSQCCVTHLLGRGSIGCQGRFNQKFLAKDIFIIIGVEEKLRRQEAEGRRLSW